MREIHRGDIYDIDFSDWGFIGSEENKRFRPGIIISNDVANGNPNNDIVTVLLLSTQVKESPLRTHLFISQKDVPGLTSDSVILTDHFRTISKQRLTSYRGKLPSCLHKPLEDRLLVTTGIFDFL